MSMPVANMPGITPVKKVGVVKLFIIGAVFVALLFILHQLWTKKSAFDNRRPWILKGTKSGKTEKPIQQDPNVNESVLLKRSENEVGGLEFSYSFWMYIDDWTYRYGQWKHVFHKGNRSSWPLRCPGVWLHPTENAMRIYMNTYRSISEFLDITDIPLNKWFHVVIAVRQKTLDVYLNGNMVRSKQLKGIPKQNYSDFYMNINGGFSGFLSEVRYYDYYIHLSEIMDSIMAGPTTNKCIDSKEVPPYFAYDWWIKSQRDTKTVVSDHNVMANDGGTRLVSINCPAQSGTSR